MTNMEFDFDGSSTPIDEELKNKIEPIFKKFVIESGAVEKELNIVPYMRLKNGIKKEFAKSIDDYENNGWAGKCYKNTWFRLITIMKKVYRFQIKASDYQLRKKLVTQLSEKFEVKILNQYYLSIDINKNDDDLIKFINSIKQELKESYVWLCEHEALPLNYACCSMWLQCSNTKHCLQEAIDVKYAKGCEYRKNLRKGLIFYGKNKNI